MKEKLKKIGKVKWHILALLISSTMFTCYHYTGSPFDISLAFFWLAMFRCEQLHSNIKDLESKVK